MLNLWSQASENFDYVQPCKIKYFCVLGWNLQSFYEGVLLLHRITAKPLI